MRTSTIINIKIENNYIQLMKVLLNQKSKMKLENNLFDKMIYDS